jgi:Fic family protein
VKERYQEIDEKNATLRECLDAHKERGREFLERYEMSWVYHDSALEGVIYSAQELQTALHPGVMAAEASLMPIVLEIRNHKAAIEYLREEAKVGGPRKQAQITLTVIKRIHDLVLGNTPELLAARAATERRERTERELNKERDRAGFRKEMPLHRTYFHEIAQPAKIQAELEKLVDYTSGAEFRESHPIRQAASVQHRFLQIFPFTEHSGKVGRMLSNLILIRNNYLPCVIHSIDRQRYYESFRSPVPVFRGLLMEAMENSVDNALKFFKDLSKKYKAIN